MTFTTVDPKDPDDIDFFGIDWGPYLSDVQETLSTSTWIMPAGITKDSDVIDGTKTIVKLSGGLAGETYSLVNRITTATRTKDRTMIVRVAHN
jgi:hypothetical protein